MGQLGLRKGWGWTEWATEEAGNLLGACVSGVGGLGHSSDCRDGFGHLLGAGPDLLMDWRVVEGGIEGMDRSRVNTGILD